MIAASDFQGRLDRVSPAVFWPRRAPSAGSRGGAIGLSIFVLFHNETFDPRTQIANIVVDVPPSHFTRHAAARGA